MAVKRGVLGFMFCAARCRRRYAVEDRTAPRMFLRGILFYAVLLLIIGGASAQSNGSAHAAGLTRCTVRAVNAPQRGTLVSDTDNIYVGSVNGTLSSYDARTLGIGWRSELGGEFASEILVVGGGLVVVTNSAGNGTQESSTIRLIGKESGVTAWSARLEFSERYYVGRLDGAIAAVSRHGAVTLLDAASGRIKRRSGPHGAITAAPAFFEERAILGTGDKQIVSISAKDVEVLNKFSIDFVPTALSVSKNGASLVGDERGNVALLNANDGKAVWKFKSGAAVSSVLETDHGILLTSLDNFVYLISDYNADVIWKRRLPGRVLEGGLVMNGHLIVFVPGENSGYVLDLDNGKVIDVIPSPEADMINRSPVFVRDRTFGLTTTNSLETYAMGPCATQ